MARLLIFSDVHGNLTALNALLRHVREDSLDGFRCLGDVVGYYGLPNGVLEAVAQRDPDFRIGNHEIGVTHYACGDDLSYQAVLAAMRHRKHLMASGRWEALCTAAKTDARLDTRYERLDGLALSYVHATPAARTPFRKVCGEYIRPTHNVDWIALSGHFAAERAQNGAGLHISFVGHSHTPLMARFEAGHRYFHQATYGQPIPLDNLQSSLLINVGSVGQPRDNVPLHNGIKFAHGVLLDTGAWTVTFVAAPYGVDFARMSDELERDGFTSDMPDDLVRETYYALEMRDSFNHSVRADNLDELRRLFDTLWRQEADRLLTMIEHPVVGDIANWRVNYTHEGFCLNHNTAL